MKLMRKRRCVTLFIVGTLLFLAEGVLPAQDVERTTTSTQVTVQQADKQVESSGNRQQDKNKTVQQQELKKSQQKKDVKKIQSSSPDLSKRKGARPPSISRPSGSGMPKGAGRPAGVNRPGRR